MLRIKELRRSKNQSQTELSKAIGVSLRTIQHWEAETSDVPTKKLREIAQYYDVTVPYLFSGEESEKQEIKKLKGFESLSIELKLNEIHDLLKIIKEAGKDTNKNVEANKELIATTNRSLFEQSMNFQESLDELEKKSKKLG
jgi:transcriptional regulator with XRE-family HTH domain